MVSATTTCGPAPGTGRATRAAAAPAPIYDPAQGLPYLKDFMVFFRPGDIVVCLGAGSITSWANSLPDDLVKLDAQSRVA